MIWILRFRNHNSRNSKLLHNFHNVNPNVYYNIINQQNHKNHKNHKKLNNKKDTFCKTGRKIRKRQKNLELNEIMQ